MVLRQDGASAMREYDEYEDDNIRLYTPVFQRVIILTAVIIAVPVMMWTITTFVRSYVARPKVPALEHVASTAASVPIATAAKAPPRAAPSTQPAPTAQMAPRADRGTASETPNPPAEANKGALALAALPDSPTGSVAANNSAPLQPVPIQTSAPAGPAPAAVPAVDTASAAAPTASLPRTSAAARPTDNGASSGATTSADRAIAWPNPNSASPPDFTASRPTRSPQAAAPVPARVAAIETVPAGEPILGRVPLPRQRPGHVAIASSGPASGGSMPRSVPLPPARPAAAPAEAPAVFEISTGRAELENAH
jgi:hypothetical protein